MNIQGANLLSLLSGSEGLSNLQQGLLGSGDQKAGFASTLMEQLGLLQNGLTGESSGALQDWLDSAKNGNGQTNLQNFAALFGTDLPPTSNKAGADIDLEDTLQTLAGVLQQLQQLEAGAQGGLPALDDANADLESAPIAEAKDSDSDSDVIAANAQFMPIMLPPAEINVASGQTTEFAPELSAVFSKKTAAASLQANAQNAQSDTVDVMSDEFGLDFDRSLGAMLAKQGGDGGAPQDKNSLGFKAESLLTQMENQADASGADKTLPGVTADIAKLNQVASGGDSAKVPAQLAMNKPVADPAWNKELGEKLIWMHKQSIPSVELRLNPEHLGPVLIKIDVSHDQASVAFTAQHLAVKEAIEAAIPKLREMLNGQQLNLADVNVSQQQSDQRQQPREFFQMASDQNRRQSSEFDTDSGAVNTTQNLVDEIEAGRAVASNGLLSLFA